MIIRPKLLIIGHARHGKDTVGDWFKTKGYTFVSSSRFVGEKAVWPEMNAMHDAYVQKGCTDPDACHLCQTGNGPSHIGISVSPVPTFPVYGAFEEAFADRRNHRKFWFDAICEYNKPDRSRLGRELYAAYDMYVGLRNWHELEALRLHKAFDLCVWVDASERCGPEPESSCTVTSAQADVIIDNNGTLDDLDKALVVLYDKWIRPLERTKNKPKAVGQCPHCYNQARITPCPVCNA